MLSALSLALRGASAIYGAVRNMSTTHDAVEQLDVTEDKEQAKEFIGIGASVGVGLATLAIPVVGEVIGAVWLAYDGYKLGKGWYDKRVTNSVLKDLQTETAQPETPKPAPIAAKRSVPRKRRTNNDAHPIEVH